MLTIAPPYYQLRGLTVFRDHEDPDQFYYLPPAPRLARNGERPLFTLFKYRRDLTDNPELEPTRARGAGFAQLEVEAALSPLQAEALRGELAGRTGRPDARLAPVLFRSAEAQAVILQSDDGRMLQTLAQHQPAPITAPHRVAFSLALSAEGASLMQRAAEGGDLPVGVTYSLRFLALTPALHARARLDYRRVYERLAASLGVEYPRVGRAELDGELAWLIENGAIQIELISFVDAEDSKRQQDLVLALLKARLEQDFFQPSLPPSPTTAGNGGALGQLLRSLINDSGEPSAASAMFVLKAKYQVEKSLKTFELTFDSRTAVELPHVSVGFLSTLLDGEATPEVRELDLDDPFFSALSVRIVSAIDFGELADLREAVVHITHGQHHQSYSFSRTAAGPYLFQIPLTRPGGDVYTYQVEYFFESDSGVGPVHLTSDPIKSWSRVLVIEPLEHFRYRRVRFLLGPLDFAVVPRIHLQLRIAPGEEGGAEPFRKRLVLDRTTQEWTFRERAALDPRAGDWPLLLAQMSWEDARGTQHEAEGESAATTDSFVVLGPFRDVLSLLVQPAVDWRRATQLVVELRYQDDAYVFERELFFTPATGSAGQRVDIPIVDPRRRSYQFRIVLLRNDGTRREDPWANADQHLLIVGADRPTDCDVRVVLVGGAAEVLGVRVDLFSEAAAPEEPPVSVFLRPEKDTEKVAVLPLGATRKLAYRYEVRRYTAAGEELTRSGQSESQLLVIQA